MTNDYKEQLLRFLTDNLEKTSPTTEEIIENINNIPRSQWSGYMPSNWTSMKIEGMIAPDETVSNIGILYGGYYLNDIDNAFGFIILINSEFIPVKIFFEDDDGTKLRYIQRLEKSEDNTFFAIDDTYYSPRFLNYSPTSLPTHTVRFLLLNNFVINNNGDYKLNIRRTYKLPDSNFYCRNVKKSTQSSTYIMIGTYYAKELSYYNNNNTRIIEFKINVGSENEWNTTDYTDKEYFLSNINFNDNDDYYYCFIYTVVSAYETTLKYYKKNYNNTTEDSNIYVFDSVNYDIKQSLSNQGVFITDDILYFVMTNQDNNFHREVHIKLGLYKFNIATNEFNIIYEKDYGIQEYVPYDEVIYINSCNNKIYIQYNKNIDLTNYKADYYIQRLENDEWNPILIEENQNFIANQRGLYIKSNFNLLQYYLFPVNLRNPTWYMKQIIEIYNTNNYNGKTYIDDNVLKPKYGNLYSDNKIVFSRNLFNNQIQNNTTISSLEIPSQYLNDISIEEQDLISETKLDMIKNNQNFVKNIYEVVDINFINSLLMINKNNVQQPILNQNGANRINNAINTSDYENSKLTKARINYTDDTSDVLEISSRVIENAVLINFTINVEKEISNIELISNDELTVYNTITDEFEVDKTYSINQKVTVEGVSIDVNQLFYNNEPILYNGEPIYIIS